MSRAAWLPALVGLCLSASSASAQPTFEEVLTRADATFDPPEARPGQTVTLKINLRLLAGWHTYPTVQPDKAAKSQTNRIVFPKGPSIVFVDDVIEPPNAKEKSEPILRIDQLLYYPGGGVWQRKAVILPTAAAGTVVAKIQIRPLLCDKDNCLPPKAVDLQASLKIMGEPVAVDPKYKTEVDRALEKK